MALIKPLTVVNWVPRATPDVFGVVRVGAGLIINAEGDLVATGEGGFSMDEIVVDNTTVEVTSNTLRVKDDGITNAKLAPVSSATFKGRFTGGSGDVEDLSVSTAKTLLNIAGTNTGDQDLSGLVPKTTTVNGAALSSNVTLTTAVLADSTNKRYVTDAQLTLLGNTSGTNTGDQNLSGLLVKANNLSDLTDASAARTNLGLGDVATHPAADFATAAQGGKADTAVQPARTVNGHALSADVTVSKSDVGLGNADNTSDANKPVSTAQQTALDAKVPNTRTVNGHALSGDISVTKSDVGLGSVVNADTTTTANITDASNKRFVTDAQQTVINNTSGTNTGDQTIALTGDVTGSGIGSFAATIANGAVSLAKMASMATASFLGRSTAGTGAPEVLSTATTKTMLGLSGTNTGDQTITLSGDISGSGTDAITTTLASVVSGATVGDATHIPVITYDAKGRITSTSTAEITASSQRTFAFFAA